MVVAEGIGEFPPIHAIARLGAAPGRCGRRDLAHAPASQGLTEAEAEHVEKNILKAYAEVADMFGGSLPQLVLDTINNLLTP